MIGLPLILPKWHKNLKIWVRGTGSSRLLRIGLTVVLYMNVTTEMTCSTRCTPLLTFHVTTKVVTETALMPWEASLTCGLVVLVTANNGWQIVLTWRSCRRFRAQKTLVRSDKNNTAGSELSALLWDGLSLGLGLWGTRFMSPAIWILICVLIARTWICELAPCVEVGKYSFISNMSSGIDSNGVVTQGMDAQCPSKQNKICGWLGQWINIHKNWL